MKVGMMKEKELKEKRVEISGKMEGNVIEVVIVLNIIEEMI